MFSHRILQVVEAPAILGRSAPTGWNVSGGALVEVSVGVAEAVVQDGEIKSLNILNQGMGFPSTDALFVKSTDGTTGPEVNLESGSLHGYQQSRLVGVENFRTSLNAFVSSFVEEVNGLYNPEDAPSEYLFGFKANLDQGDLGHQYLHGGSWALWFGRKRGVEAFSERGEYDPAFRRIRYLYLEQRFSRCAG